MRSGSRSAGSHREQSVSGHSSLPPRVASSPSQPPAVDSGAFRGRPEAEPASAIRFAKAPTGSRELTPFRSLTPYHARLDVEMDDTAVSRVRDPSTSIRLGSEAEQTSVVPGTARHRLSIASLALGVVFGAALVGLIVLLFWR